MHYRCGVDVGGTFTDLLLFDIESGASWRHKTPSTPHDSSEGILNGVEAICKNAGISPSAIDVFLHGTTVATNSVLEGKGARVGLITTKGYKQVLHIGRSFVPGGLAGWIVWAKPEPLALLEDTVEIEGRMSATGEEIRALDEADIREQIGKLKDHPLQALTISLVNAYLNGAHEVKVAQIAKQIMPDVPISLSHLVLPEMQEYERTLTTVANASVRPVVGRYIKNLRGRLERIRMQGRLALLRSDGGLMSAEKSAEHPVALLMSGPAGGVAGALRVAKQAGISNILTLDVGGTSTDVALIEGGEPRRVRTTTVGHLTVRASSLDIRTVGAGGGSIASVPMLTKALRVGPQSAGALPGPAAYAKGGLLPTVTDANVVLGYLPENLLGGTFRLDRQAATAAVQTIADALGINLMDAARGIVDVVNETMYGALRMISVQQGYDPREFALMGFGGAGPLHVNAIARLMGSYPAISPVSPGVLCALGDATTQMRFETAASLARLISDTDAQELASMLRRMETQVRAGLSADGLADAEIEASFEIDLRYSGQAFEVPLTVALNELANEGLTGIARRFDAEHKRLFTFNMDVEHEIVNLRAIALGRTIELPSIKLQRGSGNPIAAKLRDHQLWIDGGHKAAAIYDRALLLAGNVIRGPAIVIEMDATTLVEHLHIATVDEYGNLLITPA